MRKTLMPIAMLFLVLSLPGLVLAQTQTQTQTQPQANPVSKKDDRPIKKDGPLAKFYQDEEVISLQAQLRQKNKELMEMFASDKVDEEKARNLHGEIVSLSTQLGEKKFEYMLAYKKRNLDWQPHFGPKKDHRRGKKDRKKGRYNPAAWNVRPPVNSLAVQGILY